MRRAGICGKCGGEAAAQPAALFCCLGQVGQLGQVDGWRGGSQGSGGHPGPKVRMDGKSRRKVGIYPAKTVSQRHHNLDTNWTQSDCRFK